MNLYKYHTSDLKHKEHQLAIVPKLAFDHAEETGKPFPEGERAIGSNPNYAYWYARDILKGRFPAGEKAIANDNYAYWYAVNILKDRFPAGEKKIANDPEYAYKYARDILKGRFPAGEKAIATNPEYAEKYNKQFGTSL